MLLKEFLKIETFFPPCHPGEIETVTAVAELGDDISPVFPYLNAVLKGTIYDQTHQTLNFKLGGRGVTLHPTRVIVCPRPTVGSAASRRAWRSRPSWSANL